MKRGAEKGGIHNEINYLHIEVASLGGVSFQSLKSNNAVSKEEAVRATSGFLAFSTTHTDLSARRPLLGAQQASRELEL